MNKSVAIDNTKKTITVMKFALKLKPLLNNEVKMRINSKTPNKP